MIRIGAGGLGFGLLGGIGPLVEAAALQSGKILVVFEWFGGNDGLNTIVPYGDRCTTSIGRPSASTNATC